jgi:hypothetical protein
METWKRHATTPPPVRFPPPQAQDRAVRLTCADMGVSDRPGNTSSCYPDGYASIFVATSGGKISGRGQRGGGLLGGVINWKPRALHEVGAFPPPPTHP